MSSICWAEEASNAKLASLVGQNTTRPNFVFFLVDDLGWGDVGFNGSTFYETPHIDALAASGAQFSNAYAACPVCSPTRGSILTGRHPVRIDITDWLLGMPENKIREKRLLQPQDRDELALEEVTIAELLKDYGYETFFAGKWHLGNEGHYPEDQGFDINIGGCHKGAPGSYYSPWSNPRLPEVEDGIYLTDYLTEKAIDFLEERDSETPFLLYFSYYNVHTPIQANQERVEHYQDKASKLAGSTPVQAEHTVHTRMRQDNPAYASMIASVDDSVGKILASLDQLGLTKDTVVIFFSDNGGLSTQGRRGGPTHNLHLRAGKGWLYEGGVREPMVIRAPGVTNPRDVIDTPVVSMDFFPTMLELAGLKRRPDLHQDGVSLVPLLNGDPIADRSLYWHYPHYHATQWMPGASIRKGDWKLIEHYHWNEVELFDLSQDLSEAHDLSEQEPQKMEELLKELHAWQRDMNAKMPIPNPDFDPSEPSVQRKRAGKRKHLKKSKESEPTA